MGNPQSSSYNRYARLWRRLNDYMGVWQKHLASADEVRKV